MEFSLQYNGKVLCHHHYWSFNPCFNGILSSIHSSQWHGLTESCFNPCFNGILSSIRRSARIIIWITCFNPCFNGILSSISNTQSCFHLSWCFNPCFNGILSSIRFDLRTQYSSMHVSILVLMEFSLQFILNNAFFHHYNLFQSLF